MPGAPHAHVSPYDSSKNSQSSKQQQQPHTWVALYNWIKDCSSDAGTAETHASMLNSTTSRGCSIFVGTETQNKKRVQITLHPSHDTHARTKLTAYTSQQYVSISIPCPIKFPLALPGSPKIQCSYKALNTASYKRTTVNSDKGSNC